MWSLSLSLSIAINTTKLCITDNGITSSINEFQVECVYFLFQKVHFGNLWLENEDRLFTLVCFQVQAYKCFS